MTEPDDGLAGRDESILRTLDSLAALDEDEPMAIDADTHAAATRIYREVIMGRIMPRPKLFSHGGDALVFTWRESARVLYATCVDEGVALSLHDGLEYIIVEHSTIDEAVAGMAERLQSLIDGLVRPVDQGGAGE